MTLPVPNETPFESGAEQGPVGSNHQEDIAPENQKRLESMIKESREKLSEILTSGVSKQVQRLLDLRNEKWVELIRKAREEEDKRKKSRQPEPLIDLQHIGEPEFKEKMIAISASKEQFDYRSRTFFRREILEGLSMENAIRQ
ncbi:MAG: hypothetical protein U1C97_03275, partial [Candidatus Gracilibacteria bacterium]|nr:hypothetical protein [Candidatus Gracilibacteria bacterium]